MALIGGELGFAFLALIQQTLTENATLLIMGNNIATNLIIIAFPFAAMTGFLYYEINQY